MPGSPVLPPALSDSPHRWPQQPRPTPRRGPPRSPHTSSSAQSASHSHPRLAQPLRLRLALGTLRVPVCRFARASDRAHRAALTCRHLHLQSAALLRTATRHCAVLSATRSPSCAPYAAPRTISALVRRLLRPGAAPRLSLVRQPRSLAYECKNTRDHNGRRRPACSRLHSRMAHLHGLLVEYQTPSPRVAGSILRPAWQMLLAQVG